MTSARDPNLASSFDRARATSHSHAGAAFVTDHAENINGMTIGRYAPPSGDIQDQTTYLSRRRHRPSPGSAGLLRESVAGMPRTEPVMASGA